LELEEEAIGLGLFTLLVCETRGLPFQNNPSLLIRDMSAAMQ
jgi:hypothetical protein